MEYMDSDKPASTSSIDWPFSLREAAQHGVLPAVQELLQNESDAKQIVSPLIAASENGHRNCVRAMVEKTGVAKLAGEALLAASLAGHTDCVEELLHHNVKVYPKTKSRCNALCGAARGGHIAVVNLLLTWGAVADTCCHQHGITPLHIACRKGHVFLVEVLVQHGANIFVQDTSRHKRTPLDLACIEAPHPTPIIHCLIRLLGTSHIFSGKTEENTGRSLLHLSAAEGCIEAVSCLASQPDCNLLHKDNTGRTADQLTENLSIKAIIRYYIIQRKNRSDNPQQNNSRVTHPTPIIRVKSVDDSTDASTYSDIDNRRRSVDACDVLVELPDKSAKRNQITKKEIYGDEKIARDRLSLDKVVEMLEKTVLQLEGVDGKGEKVTSSDLKNDIQDIKNQIIALRHDFVAFSKVRSWRASSCSTDVISHCSSASSIPIMATTTFRVLMVLSAQIAQHKNVWEELANDLLGFIQGNFSRVVVEQIKALWPEERERTLDLLLRFHEYTTDWSQSNQFEILEKSLANLKVLRSMTGFMQLLTHSEQAGFLCDHQLKAVARQLTVNERQQIGLLLGFTQQELDDFSIRYSFSEAQCCYKMLQEWRCRQAMGVSRFNLRQLTDALSEAGQKRLVAVLLHCKTCMKPLE